MSDRAFARLLRLLPDARFVRKAEIPAGKLDGETTEQSFQYVSLYRHAIGSNICWVDGVVFMLANGFLPSHAYNLSLAWLMAPAGDDGLELAMRHNYKKLFAECMLGEHNCLIGRALLIETLMFEQDCMRPLFNRVAREPRWRETADTLAHIMGAIVSNHELTHFFMRRDAVATVSELGKLFDGRAGPAYRTMLQASGPKLAEELLCDLNAAFQIFSQEDGAFARLADSDRIRMIAFAFMIISDLMALEACAHITARQAAVEDEQIRLGSEIRLKEAFSFKLGRHPDADRRCRAVLDVLSGFLDARGEKLHGTDGDFPLPASTRATLDRVFETFMDPITPGRGQIGTDIQQRGLSQLLAESLHGHDAGAEHLLWRSKRFRLGPSEVDP